EGHGAVRGYNRPTVRVPLPPNIEVGLGRRDPDVRPLALRRAWALSLLTFLACAPLRLALPLSRELATPAGPLRVDADSDEDAAMVLRAALAASSSLSRWGAFDAPVVIRVVQDHDALEAESGMNDVAWLRAWAREEGIILQRPATWSVFGAPSSDLEELLRHELTHVLTYQLARSTQPIPLWFHEGMAMNTANQGYRFPSLEDLARYYQSHPVDPLSEPERFYRHQSALLYSVSLHAFSFLIRRYGDESVRKLLAQMRAGQSFPDAFSRSVGIKPEAFLSDFERYIRLRAFRSGRPLSSARDDSSQ
ncbi:MAG: peptidase MA family metallohydrolase, partial [Myxococcaceae bacterium]